jgi:hypothetical protein
VNLLFEQVKSRLAERVMKEKNSQRGEGQDPAGLSTILDVDIPDAPVKKILKPVTPMTTNLKKATEIQETGPTPTLADETEQEHLINGWYPEQSQPVLMDGKQIINSSVIPPKGLRYQIRPKTRR